MKKAAILAILMMSCNLRVIDDLPSRTVTFWADNEDFRVCDFEGATITVDGVGYGSIAKQPGSTADITLDVWLTQDVHAYVVYSAENPYKPSRRHVWTGEIPRSGDDHEVHLCCGGSCKL